MLREQKVKHLVRVKTGWVLGGHENAVLDGHSKKLPSKEAIISEAYDEVMTAKFLELGGGLIPIEKDIRFMGKEAILELIKKEVEKEYDNSL